MFEHVRGCFHLHERKKEKAKVAQRPKTLTRVEDGMVFTRRRNGIYESDGRPFLTMAEAHRIISGKEKGFLISTEEAPDFHAGHEKAPVILHRLGFTKPYSGDK
jgi:hypothetical protein